jgi:tyrosyl-tRNA synthetase
MWCLVRASRGRLASVRGLVADLQFRGLVQQMSDERLATMLDREPLTAYAGFDPTVDSLHVGHLLGIFNLRRLQEAGHRPVALAGGGTGMIGDPSGKSEERQLLDAETLEANLAGIRGQLGRFLDFTPSAGARQAVLVDNAEWLGPLGLLEFLRDVGKHFGVGQMIAKETVRARLATPEQGMSFTEFSYMLLQAYDFLRLFDSYGCRLQLGGSDQWGNITMGIELIRRRRGAEAWGLTWPLVVRPDGTKFGKTESGNVWLDERRTSPYQLFQFFLRSEDNIVGNYLRYYTWLDHERITELDAAVAARPEAREAQRTLAREVTTLVHGEVATANAERASAALFSEEIAKLDEGVLVDVLADAPSSTWSRDRLADGGLSLVEAMVETGLAPSRSAARTTIEQGGAYVNNRRELDRARQLGPEDLLRDRYLLLRRGKRDQHLVRFG